MLGENLAVWVKKIARATATAGNSFVSNCNHLVKILYLEKRCQSYFFMLVPVLNGLTFQCYFLYLHLHQHSFLVLGSVLAVFCVLKRAPEFGASLRDRKKGFSEASIR